ncbi:hypothetical protein EV360DRAFT_76186 [Lentinula raphanica]|nr:hypothetical protein EV360DRAFT_76186 [Lentinula raphanica]
MYRRNLRSHRTQSDPAVPGVSSGNGESDVHSESPLTPIESERGPSPKGQGYESALSEPDPAESIGPAENPATQHPRPGGMSGGRVDSTGNGAPGNSQADEPLEYLDENIVHKNENSLSSEQEHIVQLAEATLTDAQREMIDRRQGSVKLLDDEAESQEAGPSSGKGKGVDPQNWGAMDLDNDEVNPETQNQILNSLREAHKRQEPSLERRARMHNMFEEFQAWQHRESERIEAKYQAQIDELKGKILEQKRISNADLGLQMSTPTEDKEHVAKTSNEDTRKLPGRPSELIAPTSHVGRLFDQMQAARVNDPNPNGNPGNFELMDVDEVLKAKGMRIKSLKPTEIYDGWHCKSPFISEEYARDHCLPQGWPGARVSSG